LGLIFGQVWSAFSALANSILKNGGFALLQLVKTTGANWSNTGANRRSGRLCPSGIYPYRIYIPNWGTPLPGADLAQDAFSLLEHRVHAGK
jgi:hypothetical protein